MAHGTYQRCPITNESFGFVEDPGAHDYGERYARRYLELAHRYCISFREIFQMILAAKYGPEAFDPDFDIRRELSQIKWDEERDTQLLTKFKLPLEELIEVWCRGR